MQLRSLLFLAICSFATFLLWPQDASAAATWTLKLASVAPDGSPWSEALKDFEKQVEADTGGALDVRLFIGGVLGDENETTLQCSRGQIQGVGASTGALASIVPDLNVLELPYLFKSAAEADEILDKVILADAEAAFKAKGLVLGFWSENGFRSFGTTWGFVKSPADLKGHKMRSQESPVHLAMYQAFGAVPVPIPVTEVLTSLQTGVVQGYDNTPLFAFAAQWTTGTKFYSLTRHIYQPAAIVFNKAWFDGLPANVQAALMKAKTGLAITLRGEIRAMDPILLQNMQAMKIQVYTPTATELATFEAPAKTARDSYISTKASAGEKSLYNKIVTGLANYRKAGGK
jgi:tripartite ATP-independent transporter DctP family solute receptor